MKNKYITLKIYKGRASYNEHGQLISESQTMKIGYNTLEWMNLLKTAKYMGWSKLEAINVWDTKTHENSTPSDELKKEVIEILNPVVVIKLTPDQEKIAALELKIEAMASNNKSLTEPVDNKALEAARVKYHKLFDKKPHHKTPLEKLLKAIEEKETK